MAGIDRQLDIRTAHGVPAFIPGTVPPQLLDNWILDGSEIGADYLSLFKAMERVLPPSMALVYTNYNGDIQAAITRPWSHPKLQSAEPGDNLRHIYAASTEENDTEYAELISRLLIQASEGVVASVSTSYLGSERVVQVIPSGYDRALIFIRNLDEENTIDTGITRQLATLQKIIDAVRRLDHDVRSPLASMRIYKTLVSRYLDNPTEDLRERLMRHTEGFDDTLALITHLLYEIVQLTKPSPEVTEPNIERFALESLLSHVIDAELQVYSGRRINLVVAHEAREIESIRIYLWEMMSNLISNALKYSPADTRVSVEATVRGDCIYISVVDKGIGMKREDAERLFRESFRSQEAIEAAPGTGTGGVVVRDLLTHLGGVPLIETSPGKGTTITIVLPMQPPGVEPAEVGDLEFVEG